MMMIIIIKVGLPARGKVSFTLRNRSHEIPSTFLKNSPLFVSSFQKSYISKKIVAYHSWLGLKAKFFNVGNHRREVMKGKAQTFDFFSSDNKEAKEARENIALEVLDDLLLWLAQEGDVAVFDATNTTEKRRKGVLDKCMVLLLLLLLLLLSQLFPSCFCFLVSFPFFFSFFFFFKAKQSEAKQSKKKKKKNPKNICM